MTNAFAGRVFPPLDPLSGSSSERVASGAGLGQEVGESAGWVMAAASTLPLSIHEVLSK